MPRIPNYLHKASSTSSTGYARKSNGKRPAPWEGVVKYMGLEVNSWRQLMLIWVNILHFIYFWWQPALYYSCFVVIGVYHLRADNVFHFKIIKLKYWFVTKWHKVSGENSLVTKVVTGWLVCINCLLEQLQFD